VFPKTTLSSMLSTASRSGRDCCSAMLIGLPSFWLQKHPHPAVLKESLAGWLVDTLGSERGSHC
jgi:hypothetical protein